MRARLFAAAGCLLWLGASSACRSHADPLSEVGPSAPMATENEALPRLELTDETPNLLLTWLGEEGDFHVVEKIDAIPPERRRQVRVVVTDRGAGTGQVVYVADLAAKQADGTYPITTLPRAEWEKLGADLRKTRMEALAPGQPGASNPAAGAESSEALGGAISAIVYGADWCKPCHDAERYLKSLGVAVTKKNIEQSRAAQAEMQEKLTRANRPGASIPVIDVMGRIFVGYSPGPLKQAVDAAKHAAVQKRG
jgi:glutaredoxin